MASPHVSVLLPARDAAETVERAVRSVIGQSFRSWEMVAVDDGSTDGTGEILSRLAAADPRIRVVQGEGQGLVAALRRGLSQCKAELIARMDADDEALPQRLACSVEALERDAQLGGVGTQVEIVREDRPVSPNMQRYAQWLNTLTSAERLYADRFVESPLCHPSTLLRRSALERVGGWEEGDFAEDYQLWLRMLGSGYGLRAVAPVLLRWSDRPSRLTRSDPRYREAAFMSLKAEFLIRSVLVKDRPIWIWGAGSIALALSRQLRARGATIDRYIEVDPKRIGQRIDAVPVVSMDTVAAPEGPHLIAAVGAKGAREAIRGFLWERGWTEGVDFTCAA